MNHGLTEYRAFFVILIFLFHAGVLPIGGTFGVTAFFILSGFCTAYYCYCRYDVKTSYSEYLKKRLVKYYPLHWLLLLPALISEFFTGYSLVKSSLILIANFLLIQSWIPINEVFFSYNAVSWYLSVTIFFVIISYPPLLEKYMGCKSSTKVFIFLLVISLQILLFTLLPKNLIHPIMYINPLVRFADFLFGVNVAMLYPTIVKRRIIIKLFGVIIKYRILYPTIVGLVFLVSIIFFSDYFGKYAYLSLIYWLPCLLVLLICSVTYFHHILFFRFLGSVSFEFFMVHQLTMNFITKCMQYGFLPEMNSYIVVLIDFLVALLLALLLHKYFTIPLTNKLRQPIEKS